MIDETALEARVKTLEEDMTIIKPMVADINADMQTVVNILTATKGAAAFAAKHGPRAIAFVAGIFAAAGLGNPDVMHFIQHFFG